MHKKLARLALIIFLMLTLALGLFQASSPSLVAASVGHSPLAVSHFGNHPTAFCDDFGFDWGCFIPMVGWNT